MALLYTGLDPTHYKTDKQIHHVSFIEIEPRDLGEIHMRVLFERLPEYTHIVFTSRTAARLFQRACTFFSVSCPHPVELIAIGKGTAQEMKGLGMSPTLIADNQTQEGIIEVLERQNLSSAYFFLPRSALSRPLLTHFLLQRGIRHEICDLYDTRHVIPHPLPNLEEFDEVVFTSPSSVDAFLKAYGTIPGHMEIKSIGPITQSYVFQKLKTPL